MTAIEAVTRVRDGMVGKDYTWHRNPAGPSDVHRIISDATGFDAGDEFTSEGDVRAYFTVEAMQGMFGAHGIADQAILDAMADAVIEHRWHCAFADDAPCPGCRGSGRPLSYVLFDPEREQWMVYRGGWYPCEICRGRGSVMRPVTTDPTA